MDCKKGTRSFTEISPDCKRIAIVGSPNVGKSSIFNNLSGLYATVSNYPGTTVELFRTQLNIAGNECDVIDTPGMYSFLPLSEEERIARLILIKDKPDLVVHVGTAKNLDRTLPLTLQLIEAGLNVILVLNIMDEARKDGMKINIEKLEQELAIPVVPTVSVRSEGISQLKKTINKALKANSSQKEKRVKYLPVIEEVLERGESCLTKRYFLSKRSLVLLALQEDEEILSLIDKTESKNVLDKLSEITEELKEKIHQPVEYLINLSLQQRVNDLIAKVVSQVEKKTKDMSRVIGEWVSKPIIGFPLLFCFLYFGIYKLVGSFGAGVCVDFLENTVFKGYINPFFISIFDKIAPWQWLNSLFVGEYGIITLGIRYAVAIVLPIVGIFFFVFSFAEDTGYLPRMGALLDRSFKKIGLSGRAVIPMVLGLGCATMATMVTRILPTKRERIISTFLLSLAVPCSAQLGVIVGILSQQKGALLIWFLVITFIFGLVGFCLDKVLKGKRPSFFTELPPMRIPRISNIFVKTYMRLKWYFKEVLPLFIWASVFIWLGQITKIFDLLLRLLHGPLELIGLSRDMSPVFLFGFFRRDYGAAGLYDLVKQGLVSQRELIIASVVLTLFLPCIAQFLMNIKERGMKMSIGITVFILGFSFTVGFFLNKVLLIWGVN